MENIIYVKRDGKYLPLIHERQIASSLDTKPKTLAKRRQRLLKTTPDAEIKVIKIVGGIYYFDTNMPKMP
jgi:hypothetical protein